MLNDENPYRSPLAECCDRNSEDSPLCAVGLIWGKIGGVSAWLIVLSRWAAKLAGETADDALAGLFGAAIVIGVIGLGMMVVGSVRRV